MTEHAERFTGRVADYERYRLRYPMEVLDVLRERCGLSAASVVADVGAGTGMLAELFLENGNHVIAVEPNAEMREACERMRKRYAGLTVVAAAAEATTLKDASVDVVSVGRAWHWFDRERAVGEFRRILRPSGWVVLVSNRRAKDNSPEAKAYEEILMEFGEDYREVHRETREAAEVVPLFGAGAIVKETIRGEQVLTLEKLLGQTQSLSVAPMPSDAKYPEMQEALRDLFARFQRDGVLRMGTVCSVMACQGSAG
jgi:ubiquinone/menaquinone biosynthesis C-methylase UbiE